MKRWLRKTKKKPQFFVATIVIIGVAALGIRYLFVGHAASPYASVNAATGQLSGGATIQTDPSASSGKSVQFSPYCQPSQLPSVTPDTSLDKVISGQLGPGWIAGDASYSALLPNGQDAFDFSDTLIGTAQTDGTAAFTGFIHNSELVGKLPSLSAIYGGTYNAPQTLITDTNNNGGQWQVAGTYAENNQQLIFVNEFIPGTNGPLSSTLSGNSGIAVMTLPAGGLPTYTSVTAIPTDSATQWGNAVTSDNTYNYIYGFAGSGMKLARVPLGKTLDISDWQYWNGKSWVSGESNAVVISTTDQLTGVTKDSGDGYIAVSIPNSVYTDKSIFVSYACTPQGPWSVPVAVYTIPEISEYSNEIAYMATFHPELTDSNGFVVSYSVNTLSGLTPLQTNIHEYQPRFVYLK